MQDPSARSARRGEPSKGLLERVHAAVRPILPIDHGHEAIEHDLVASVLFLDQKRDPRHLGLEAVYLGLEAVDLALEAVDLALDAMDLGLEFVSKLIDAL